MKIDTAQAPTPRVDEVMHLHRAPEAEIWVLARQLERELAQARADIEERDRQLAIASTKVEQNIRLIAQLAQAREALRGLLEHFMWRYCRGKKEGREYDLPPQVLAAEAALAQGGEERNPRDAEKL